MAAARATRTTCPYCGVGCGVTVTPEGLVAGDPDHSANAGRLCSKGNALGETLGLEGRLLAPKIAGRESNWNEALDVVAECFSRTIAAHGPDSVAFYVSGQLLTEDYYVANKLMKGFIGSGNIDTNSRLCMASSVAGHRRAFGEDLVPGCYEDFELADLVVLVGSNAAWCHPVLYQRLLRAKEARGTRIVVIDPRRTASADCADLYLSIVPGSDVVLFNGLLVYLARNGALDRDYIARATTGFEDALMAARRDGAELESVALRCGLSLAELERLYSWFAETPRTVTAYSQGVNQSTRGTDKVNAIINCHLATGRIGQQGAGPFSITGQPNAMGGREVGGLANQIAAHMSFEHLDHIATVRDFWGAPGIATAPGLKAVDMFEAVGAGQIKAIWIMGTNPAVSMPEAERVRAALAGCPFVVVSDCTARSDTTGFAHVLLPAASWGEKDGTVTNSDRTISRQRAFRPPPGMAKPDWWIVSQVAHRMGFGKALSYEHPAEIFREHAALSAFQNAGRRVFNLEALAGLSREVYEGLEPLPWPVTRASPHGTKRICGDGAFPTADGRARFVAVVYHPPAQGTSAKRPFVLNTGRMRDQWHTMTRTGGVARLAAHTPEPVLSINPGDAGRADIKQGQLVMVESGQGRAVARAALTEAIAPGSVFLPMHWSDRFTANCVAGRVVNADNDLVSGQPELKHTPVSLVSVPQGWEAFLFSRDEVSIEGVFYWARHAVDGGYAYELAGPEDASEFFDRWTQFGAPSYGADVIDIHDARRGVLRRAILRGGVVESCLFAGPAGTLPPRDFVLSAFVGRLALEGEARGTLLSGRSNGERSVQTICACFNVAVGQIVEAIRTQHVTDVRTLGKLLNAGTNCGSCVAELKEIIAREAALVTS
jgi:assimilatory nitrate reductase catalytic subunit